MGRFAQSGPIACHAHPSQAVCEGCRTLFHRSSSIIPHPSSIIDHKESIIDHGSSIIDHLASGIQLLASSSSFWLWLPTSSHQLPTSSREVLGPVRTFSTETMLRQALEDISGYQENAKMHWRCFELIGAHLAQGAWISNHGSVKTLCTDCVTEEGRA